MYRNLLALMSLVGLSFALPAVHVHPVPPKDVGRIEITHKNTLNATSVTPAPKSKSDAAGTLPFALVNNFPGAINAYITGLDTNGALYLVKADGSLYYPPNPAAGLPPQQITEDIAIPLGGQGSTTHVNLNQYISAGRIWFAAGELTFYVNNGNSGPSLVEPSATNPSDPSAGINWGFAELTWNSDQLYANISYVDFVGLVIGMLLATAAGGTQSAKGLPAGAVSNICSALSAQAAKDGGPWDQLCVVDGSGNPLRVLAPNNILSGVDNAFGNYWTDYINSVWDHYSSNTLTINSQNGDGDLHAKVSSSTGNLEFDNGGSFQKPTAGDIFGCNSGPFANTGDSAHLSIVARLCAAFNRGDLLVSGGDAQPNGITDYSLYYSSNPNNQYSRIVHSQEVDGKGYAFAYDDVNPDGGADQSGAVHDPNPTLLTLTVGGPS